MKQIVVLSGKGGTGKTSLTACFAVIFGRAVLADCDVDAANLHLLLSPETEQKFEFRSGEIAIIDSEVCIGCFACQQHCRYDAIRSVEDGFGQRVAEVIETACEGCGVCSAVCSCDAVQMQENLCGTWNTAVTRVGPMVYARLNAGAENSGKLVAMVRQEAQQIGEQKGSELILIDGPPGIACPAIASLSGATFAVLVTEPTKSGFHDLRRAVQLSQNFGVPAGVCINKCDINSGISADIESYCKASGLAFLGCVPYDESIVEAQLQQLTAVEVGAPSAAAIEQVWANVVKEGGCGGE